jgi:hypothetical protein
MSVTFSYPYIFNTIDSFFSFVDAVSSPDIEIFDYSSMIIDPDLAEIAKEYIKQWCISDSISNYLLKDSIKLWQNSSEFPTLETLINYYFNHPCDCCLTLQDDHHKHLIQLSLVNLGMQPSCMFTTGFKIFLSENNNRLPTFTEVNSVLERAFSERDINFEDYFNNKVDVGTENLEHMPAIVNNNDEEYDCSLCMEKISKGQSYYKLTPCGHTFHSLDADCIDSTIITWLEKNHTCPNCRKDVIIEAPSSDIKNEKDNKNDTSNNKIIELDSKDDDNDFDEMYLCNHDD